MSTPVDPRSGRFDAIVKLLQVAMVLTGVCAAIGAFITGPVADAAQLATVGVLLIAPLSRVTWLIGRWFHRGDPKYALVGTGVLAVMLLGTVLSR
jgi:hypothetical protein